MKKLISVVVATTMLLSVSMVPVLAKNGRGLPPGLAKKENHLPPGIAKKVFGDLEGHPWAQKAIEAMKSKGLVKGYDDGQYKPQSAVTKLETVIMALRIMGWEDDAKTMRALPKSYKGSNVAEWAKGYVAAAFSKGILDEVDMLYFKPEEPAKRFEVAKYVIRALGYEEEAQDHMDEKLDFMDASFIPQGAVGYVYLVNDMKIMKGSNDAFNPMGALTRAEMAVLFQRLDEKVESEVDEGEVTGKVSEVSDNEITLMVDNQRKTYEVDDDVIVYDGDDRIELDDIEVNSIVKVEIEDQQVVYIEIKDEDDDDRIISKYSGEITDIDKGTTKKITVKNERLQMVFEVVSNVEVIFDDEKGSFDNLKVGDEISIIVDSSNRARKVYTDRELEDEEDKEVKGIITDLDSNSIKVKTNGTTTEYRFADVFKVYINDKSCDYDDLEEGMEVELKITDNRVYRIDAEVEDRTIDGEVTVISQNDEGYLFTLKSDGESKSYEVSKDVKIEIEGKSNEKITDINVGDEGEFTLENNIIVEIEIED